MNFIHLKYALEVERTGSISRAAEALFMSQPHLSKAIRELEESVGITIFSRTSRGVSPTVEGKEFLDRARDIMLQIDEMENMYRQSSERRQKFSLCVPRAGYLSSVFTSLIQEFSFDQHFTVDYRETNAMEAIKNVANAVNDLGIIRYESAYEPYFLNALDERFLQFAPIWEFEARILMSDQHPLAKQKKIARAELDDYVELVYGDFVIPSLPVAQARQIAQEERDKKKISIYDRAGQFEILMKLPTAFAWISPVLPEWLEPFSLIQKQCSTEKRMFKDLLIYRKGYRFTQYDKRFHKLLLEATASLR